jgi:hypothetical protein
MPILQLANETTVAVRRPEPPTVAAERPGSGPTVVVPRRGPAGTPGAAGGTFSHHQPTPAATWVITHNLGRYAVPVLLIDDDPHRPVWADYDTPDPDHTTVTLPAPATGWAHF